MVVVTHGTKLSPHGEILDRIAAAGLAITDRGERTVIVRIIVPALRPIVAALLGGDARGVVLAIVKLDERPSEQLAAGFCGVRHVPAETPGALGSARSAALALVSVGQDLVDGAVQTVVMVELVALLALRRGGVLSGLIIVLALKDPSSGVGVTGTIVAESRPCGEHELTVHHMR